MTAHTPPPPTSISSSLDEHSIPPNIPQSVDSLPPHLHQQQQQNGDDHDHDRELVIHNYIGGSFRAPHSGQYLVNRDPSDGHVLAYVARSHRSDVEEAVKCARAVHESGAWRNKTEQERARVLDMIADRIESKLEQLALWESLDNGKPVTLARTMDIPRAVDNFRFFAGAIRHQSTACHTMGTHAVNYTLRRPVGVCALITPWNLPLYLLSWKVAPALACGNTVVAKCSELTPLTAHALAEIIDSIDESLMPRGTFNLVHGYGRECGSALVEAEDVSLVSFTGGTATGRIVGRTASEQFKKVSLELGGKNSMLVFDDCNLEDAVQTAKRASFTNQGEVCLCCSRILVQEGIYDEFVSKFVDLVKSTIKIGDPRSPDTSMGPVISVEHRAKIEYYLNLAVQVEGGTIATGGKRPQIVLDERFKDGAFLEPTVIIGLSPDSRTSTEEIFGPVVTIHKFKDEDDAIRMANCVKYGLCASVFTSNLSRAHRVSDLLETGMVWNNCWLLRDLRVPFGGVKQSGVGREGGAYSLEFYSEEKNVCIKL